MKTCNNSAGSSEMLQAVHTPEKKERPNLEKLVAFIESMDDDGELIQAFVAILKMSLNSNEHSFKEFKIGI